MKTFRRDRLLRLVEAGRVELLSSYHFDDMHGESGKAEDTLARPVAIMPENWRDKKDGIAYLYGSDFTSGSGRCWYEDEANNILCLYVHSNCNYTLRVKA